MSEWQVLGQVVAVGGCTLLWRWPGFIGSLLGVAVVMVFRAF